MYHEYAETATPLVYEQSHRDLGWESSSRDRRQTRYSTNMCQLAKRTEKVNPSQEGNGLKSVSPWVMWEIRVQVS